MSISDEDNHQLIVKYYESIVSSQDSIKHLLLSSVLPSFGVIGYDLVIHFKYINHSNSKLILEYIIKLCALSLQLDVNLIDHKDIKTFFSSLESDLKDQKLFNIFGNSLDSDLSLLFPHLLLREEVIRFINPCLDYISLELSPLKAKCEQLDLTKKVVERPALFWPTISQFGQILVKSSCHSVIAEIAYNFRLAVEPNQNKSQTIFDYYPYYLHKSLILLRLFEQVDSIQSGFNAKKFSIAQELCVASKQTPDNDFRLLLLIYPSVAKYIYHHKSCIQQNYFV